MTQVHGTLVDEQTRCIHYRSGSDVVAIKFKCCRKYYACFECHQDLESHTPQRWESEEFNQPAILCGVCATEISIGDYLSSGSACPSCRSPFNPGCASHYHYYFRIRDNES